MELVQLKALMEYVTLKELAAELNIHKTNLMKYISKIGMATIQVRTAATRNQLSLALTKKDAELLRQKRIEQGYMGETTGYPKDISSGLFYVAQPMPKELPNRVKLGWTTKIKARTDSYKTLAPDIMVLKTWPCFAAWEPVVIQSVTRVGCVQIGQELFDCDNVEELLERCSEFFSIMPKLESRNEK